MEPIHKHVQALPSVLDVLSLCNREGIIPIHVDLYATLDQVGDRWFFEVNHPARERVVPSSDPLLLVLQDLFKEHGPLIPTLVLWLVVRTRFQGKGRTQFENLFLSLKMRVSAALKNHTLPVGASLLIQTLFQNPLYLGVASVADCTYSQIAACLSLPLQEEHLMGLVDFIKTKREHLKNKQNLRLEEEVLMALLSDRAVEESLSIRGEQILVVLGKIGFPDAPLALQSLSSAYAVAACWTDVQKRKNEALALEHIFSLLQKTEDWSYGSQRKYYCVLIQGDDARERLGYHWGNRSILVFSKSTQAVDFVWQNQDRPLRLTKTMLRYPDAEEVCWLDLSTTEPIDVSSLRAEIQPHANCSGILVGSTEKYYVRQGRLLLQLPVSEDEQKENAKKELEKLFIDFENED